jgi:2-iminoacetate synthase ThiH
MLKKKLFDDDEKLDYYLNDQGFVVFTADFLLNRGYCCGNGCRHCPFEYKEVKNEQLKQKLIAEQKLQSEKNNHR